MLSRKEAKEVYDASRRWDYWTDSLMEIAKSFGDDPKTAWKDAVSGVERLAKRAGEDPEELSVEVIELLSRLGVNDRKLLAKATLDWAFMMRYMGKGKDERDDSYKEFLNDGVLGNDGLRELSDYYWEDVESGEQVL